jgi:hypothetical protein
VNDYEKSTIEKAAAADALGRFDLTASFGDGIEKEFPKPDKPQSTTEEAPE